MPWNFEIECRRLILATLAFHTGYYDAAHLANEIKALTGHTSSTLYQLMCFSEDAESIEWFLGA